MWDGKCQKVIYGCSLIRISGSKQIVVIILRIDIQKIAICYSSIESCKDFQLMISYKNPFYRPFLFTQINLDH